MRILRVIASMDPRHGGPSQGIRNSIPEMNRAGIANEIACLDEPDAFFLKSDNLTIHALGPRKSAWQYSSKLKPWLIKNLMRFDIVIIHGLWLYHSFTVTRLRKMLSEAGETHTNPPKVFIMPHGMLDPYFQRAKNRKLKAIRNWLYWKFIEAKVIEEADGILFTCEEELKSAREAFLPYRPKRELNIGYGIIDPPKETLAMSAAFYSKVVELDQRPYLLFLGRINEKKGIDLLIKAYNNLSRQVNSEQEIPALVIAGPGLETGYEKEIQALAKLVTLPGKIVFSEMLTGEQKWGAFYGCEAFILPSRQENFGIAVVEAMACCKPVLISNKVNIFKEINDGKCGLIANDDVDEIQNQLKTWFLTPLEEKDTMGRNARKTYLEKFEISKNVALLIKEINNIDQHV